MLLEFFVLELFALRESCGCRGRVEIGIKVQGLDVWHAYDAICTYP